MKKFMKPIALLLCVSLLASIFTGCSFPNSYGSSDTQKETTTQDTDSESQSQKESPTQESVGGNSAEDADPPYLENYYVNKHTPVCVKGRMDVYKYDKNSADLWMGGYAYHGGLKLNSNVSEDTAQVDLPLEGLYQNISFVIGGKCGEISMRDDGSGNMIPSYSNQYNCAPPTLTGEAAESKAGLQFWVDNKMVDEVLFSNYQVPVRYTYDVAGAEKFSIKIVTGGDDLAQGVPVLELTVWDGEAQQTGHIPEPATDEPVQLIKDLKPYLIPSTSGAIYYPNFNDDSNGRNYINMCGVTYENVISTYVAEALIGEDEEDIYFNLEGKYNNLTFTAGVADRNTSFDEGSAWLTVYADGKIIYEELYSSHELQKKVELDVTGCHQLKFGWAAEAGNENFGTAVGNFYGIGDAYVTTTKEALNTIKYSSRDLPDRPVKMVSELGTFGVVSNMQDQTVFDGSTQFKIFSMGGVKYNEGIMLHSINNILFTKPANASFNLDGKYDTISFVAGHISNSNVYENDQIEIYADGELIQVIELKCTMLPQEYIVDVTGCKHLEFVSGKLSNYLLERPVFGIANLVAYPDGYVETDLFPERKPSDFGNTCDLIDTFGFYDVYNSHVSKQVGTVSVVDGYYDGTTNKNSFQIGNKTYNKGILLKTNIHLEMDLAGVGGAAVLGSMLTGWGLSVLALAASGEAHESAFAMANIKNSGYTSVTFTVAMQKDCSSSIVQDETTLMIGADDESVWETTLYKDMEPTTYTVELGEDCERLMFWLDCSTEDDGSHTYAIYDITLNK